MRVCDDIDYPVDTGNNIGQGRPGKNDGHMHLELLMVDDSICPLPIILFIHPPEIEKDTPPD